MFEFCGRAAGGADEYAAAQDRRSAEAAPPFRSDDLDVERRVFANGPDAECFPRRVEQPRIDARHLADTDVKRVDRLRVVSRGVRHHCVIQRLDDRILMHRRQGLGLRAW